ncbi:MAG: penicillin-binding protein activator, partial [Notoacmeibacter sp.]|nr:penicillin-binding protein activator [Notoacmeibacter sp.]
RACLITAILGATLLVGSCQNVPNGFPDLSAGLTPQAQAPAAPAPQVPAVLPPASGEVIGAGPVRVALLIPKGAPGNAGVAASSLRNAAILAMEDFGSSIQLVVKDTGGVATTATDVAGEAFNEGASLVLGPLFAGNVSAVSGVLSPRGKLMIAFSSDRSVARPGVYLQSYLPDAMISRTLNHAASSGVKRIVAILPEGQFGTLAEQVSSRVMTQTGGQVSKVVRYTYDDGSVERAVEEAAPFIADADGVFIPDGGTTPGAIAAAFARKGTPLTGKRLLGTAQWSGSDLSNPVFNGAWYADSDTSRQGEFLRRYKQKFGADPVPFAALAYDAVALAAGLARNGGPAAFTRQAIEQPGGYNGYGGIFRFRADGTNERGYAVYEVAPGGTRIVSPAPQSFNLGG